MIFFSFSVQLVHTIAEEATRLYEQSPEAGHEVRKGYFGLQTLFEISPQGKGKDDPYRLQLSSLAKV
jgi:hypothetical protein